LTKRQLLLTLLRKSSNEKSERKDNSGLSDFLSDYKPLMDVIKKTEIKTLILPSGISLPKPSELLGFLQNVYDYLIIHDASKKGAQAMERP
jgi:hypothetical protein